MSKILITALGSGTYNKEKKIKEYNPTKYYVEEGDHLKETPFIASAIDEKWRMDKIIIIGTTGSMWSNVYKHYCDKENIEIDIKYYNKLKEVELFSKKDTPIEDLNIEKFNTTFNGKIKGIVVKYGINDKENLENFYSIIGIENEIENEDEVFIDITHAFRSMSFWLFLVITYLINVTEKNIEVKNITYGMFDASDKEKGTPIISLNLFNDILKWFKGASELKNYGNSYSILKELELISEDKEIKNELENFSDTMNINYIDALEKSFNNFESIKDKVKQIEGPGKYIVPKILENFIDEFNFQNNEKISIEKRKYLLRARLAEWHFKQKRYAMAAININEAIADFIMETLKFPIVENGIKTDRTLLAKYWLEQVKKINEEDLSKYGKMYTETRDIRNKVAHSLDNERELKEDIKKLEIYSNNIFNLLNSEDLVRKKDQELGISEKIKKQEEEKNNEKRRQQEQEKNEFAKLLVISSKGLIEKDEKVIRDTFKISGQLLYLSKKEKEEWKNASEKNDIDLSQFEKIIDKKVCEGDYILIIGNSENVEKLQEYSKSKNLKILKETFKKSFEVF